MNQERRTGAFTLIEIMAVVLIIGLLSTIVGVQIFAQVDKGRITATAAQISNLEAILELSHEKSNDWASGVYAAVRLCLKKGLRMKGRSIAAMLEKELLKKESSDD